MIDKLRTAVRHPWTAVRRCKKEVTRPFIDRPEERIDHFEEDWDNLVLLDACRFDTMAEHNCFEGSLESVYSSASHTAEFIAKNLAETHRDTVWVTASPQVAGYEDRLHDTVHVWREHWDEERKTVLPGDVTSAGIEAAERYPNKRLVVHYMQPHYPFVGETGRELGPTGTYTGGVTERERDTVWDRVTAGDLDPETVRQAYEENLQIALPHVEALVSELAGKTVVSSDHGNLFGKRVCFLPITIEAHPQDYPERELVRVPWLELPYEERRTVVEGDAARSDADGQGSDDPDPDGTAVQERLESLGYVS